MGINEKLYIYIYIPTLKKVLKCKKYWKRAKSIDCFI